VHLCLQLRQQEDRRGRVYTNTVPAGAFRGYGLPQTNFAVESAMDDLARKIGMDPIAFRERT